MEVLYGILSWGSPLGLALFLFFSASGAGIFFWGFSHFIKSNKKDKEKKQMKITRYRIELNPWSVVANSNALANTKNTKHESGGSQTFY